MKTKPAYTFDFGREVDFRRLCSSIHHPIPKAASVLEEVQHMLLGCRCPAIAELSGMDSVAAIIRAGERLSFDAILPTIVLTGTEFGSPAFVRRNYDLIVKRLQKNSCLILEPLIYTDFDFWRALCGRFIQAQIDRWAAYTPCVGCHLYLHAMRIPLATRLGINYIVSGERESHSGRIKLNQTSRSLDAHINLMESWGLKFVLPLRHVERRSEVMAIAGRDIFPGEDQFQCLFSDNYRDVSGKNIQHSDWVAQYYDELGLPLTKTLVRALLVDPSARLVEIAEDFVREWSIER